MDRNRVIFYNTIFLYIRMILIMGISLYTTRIVYKILGIEDFGLFNLIAGFIVLFTFLNSAMRSASQRYLNVSLASGDYDKTNNTLNASIVLHIGISIIILLLAETIGLWLLNNKLNIETDRVYAANIVYQCAILTTIINIISVPFQSIILAKERMKYFAYIGIFEALAKLVIVFFLILFQSLDSLILYSSLLVAVAFCILSMYLMSAFKCFKFKYSRKSNTRLVKEMFSFSSWSLFGQIALLSSNQGISILFNIFYGTTINAALAIANQVTAIVHGFSSNLQAAFNPQIVQTHTKENFDEHKQLVLSTSKYSLFLMSFLAIPFLLNTEFLLKIWLGNNLANNTVFFTKMVLLFALLDSISGPFWMSAHAAGNIKKYQIILSIILILNLPISYVFLTLGFAAPQVFFIGFITNLFVLVFRFLYFKMSLCIPISQLKTYILRVSTLYLALCTVTYFSQSFSKNNIIDVFIWTFLIELFLLAFILIFGLTKNELTYIKKVFMNKINKKTNNSYL